MYVYACICIYLTTYDTGVCTPFFISSTVGVVSNRYQGSYSVSTDEGVHVYTVPLIYNFTFTCVYTHGTMQYLASKNPWFAVEKFFSTRRVVASCVAFHDMSLGISTTRVISTRRGFSHNE